MIRLSGYRFRVDIPIEIIGSRPGEKFDEELSTPDEEVLSTSHPHIHRLAPVAPHHDALNSGLGRLYEASDVVMPGGPFSPFQFVQFGNSEG